MHCHCGTNNRVPRWTFTDLCKPEVRPGARECLKAKIQFDVNVVAIDVANDVLSVW